MCYLKDNYTGEKGKPLTKFDLKRNENDLVFYFDASESSLKSYSDKDNDDLWRKNVVEVFLDLGDDFYYEFEVAPNGKTFVAQILNGKITFIRNDFFSSNVEIEGNTYKVTMVINLNKLNTSKGIRYNAFRVETKNVGGPQNLQALNPTLCGTFHVREKFIPLQ